MTAVQNPERRAAPPAEPLTPLTRLSRQRGREQDNEDNGVNLPAATADAKASFHPNKAAVELLAAARSAGVVIAVTGSGLRLRAEREPPPGLLARIREHKPALVGILTGQRCRHCGQLIHWQQPGPVAFADGTAAHGPCYERVEIARQLAGGRQWPGGAGRQPAALDNPFWLLSP